MLDVKENKIVTIKDGKGGKFSFTTPVDFVVTQEYIDDKINNQERTRCEEWLKDNDFVEEPRGWSLYSDKKVIEIPQTFYNYKAQNFYIKFHRIENVSEFRFIHFGIQAKKIKLSTLNNLPNYIDDKTSLSFPGILSNFDKEIYLEIAKSGLMLQEFDETLDDMFLHYLVKKDHLDKIKDYNINRFNKELFKLKPEVYNLLNSLSTVQKFKL